MAKKFIIQFEAMEIEAEDIEEVKQIYAFMNTKPEINRVLLSKELDHD